MSYYDENVNIIGLITSIIEGLKAATRPPSRSEADRQTSGRACVRFIDCGLKMCFVRDAMQLHFCLRQVLISPKLNLQRRA
jgi:hypothetical protein